MISTCVRRELGFWEVLQGASRQGGGGKGGVEWTVPYPTPEKLYFLLSTVSGTKMSLGFQYDPNLHPDHQGEAPGLDAKNLVP